MALDDNQASAMSPNAVRALLRTEYIGGPGILAQEDPYSEVLVQSVSFFGGPYLVSPGSGEHTVADLENLMDAAFREPWMPNDLRGPARQLIQGLLMVSDMVLKRAGLTRGTLPSGSARTPVYVPGSNWLEELSRAAFLSNDELDAHGAWLRMVIDTLALNPGELVDPCVDDITDDRLYISPFLRLSSGYQLVLPLDLLITIRFHLLRFVRQEGELEKFGRQWRDAAFRRVMRLLPRDASPVALENDGVMSRYLLPIDSKRDLHIIVATDPLVDWQLDVWGTYGTQAAMSQLAHLMEPDVRRTYSSAETTLHLVITDSPGRGAVWGIPNIADSDPVLMARSDDLEIMLHHEPDGPLGLLLFAEAVDRRPGESFSTAVLDEFSSYNDHEKSFYFTDGKPATFTLFQTADGIQPRKKYFTETDRHGVIPPVKNPSVLQAQRRYERDAPEIFIIEPHSSYLGYVVELDVRDIFVTIDPDSTEHTGLDLDLLECVAYWVRECAIHTENQSASTTTELVIRRGDPEAWKMTSDWSRSQPAIRVSPMTSGFTLELTETFVALLQEKKNTAERELVSALLVSLFDIDRTELGLPLSKIAPLGTKRMLNSFNQSTNPDMLAHRLPRPLTGHDQVAAQLLDELGEWLRSPNGGNFSVGNFEGHARTELLKSTVGHLFNVLETEIAGYDQRILLDFLIAQNETLSHDAKVNATMLKSRLACFGENSHTVTELVEHRKESASAQRANRFLIEYVAAQPPSGTNTIDVRDYYRLLSVAKELIDRATASDLLHYGIADFQVSILDSGRLGLSRNESVTTAMEIYATASSRRSVRSAQSEDASPETDVFDYAEFIERSADAMRAEFGFTFTELRAVCGGLLEIATADQVTRIDRSEAISKIIEKTALTDSTVNAVLDRIVLTARASFLEIKEDAWPWRYNRDSSYIRRPLVQQGNELVFGFRSIYRLGLYWLDNLLSGRLQGRAKTTEMQRCISEARGRINDAFAHSVAARLQALGMTTLVSVKKIGKNRIVDPNGQDLGDIDVLAYHPDTRSILAVEAKDFEIARTPAEMSNELEKLFHGKKKKKPTVELHQRRMEWLRNNVADVVQAMGTNSNGAPCKLIGLIVTSDPLVTPLVEASPLPVIPFDDVELETLGLIPNRPVRTPNKKHKRR
ncbi:hypothetical protein [Paeniglutamicibacter kerguelensis]|uniref:NERD domain-containing protein n=1 Tax=Paeniglutamicibacter kerguelensis TaxID=254788 RepID=A0ABS4XJ01_9MICC|nr:hypothetical protein [Paeniglutamicibacter kerguelensis]MBP2388437.1 hypothetical protein [Paeniglutamicibacter kerguelensis]